MAKFYGKIGYVEMIETSAGVWKEKATEFNYSGDVIRNSKHYENDGQQVNPNLTLNNEISIVADPFAYLNFQSIRYVVWMGAKWKVNNVTVDRPRLKLTVGGIYNGK